MKLCDVAQAYHPSSGGIKTYLAEKRAYLERGGAHDHLLIVPGARTSTHREGRAALHTIGSPIIPGCAPYRLLARADRVAAVFARERPDVIEIDGPYLGAWLALRHRARVPSGVVVFHHTDVPRAYVEPAVRHLFGGRAARRARRLALRYLLALYRRCDLVLTASPRVERSLRRCGVQRTATVPLGVDLDLFHPARRDPELRARLGVGPDDPLLVYAGRLDTEKRPDLVIDAFLRLPAALGAHLVLLGDGPLKPRLAARAAVFPRLHLLPYETDRAAFATILASADVYVSAAPHETFGLSVIEAQAAGLPTVGVRAGAMLERVPPSVGVLAEPGSPESLAAAITAMWSTNPRERGRRARRLVAAAFSWRATFDRLLTVYAEVHHRARTLVSLLGRHPLLQPAVD
jgi:alpha-1,6-mannosyltransferase